MKFKVKHIVMLAANAAIIAVMTVANCILFEPTLAQNITGLLCPPVVNQELLEQSRAEGQELSKDIVREGSVLVKNNGVLPLDYGTSSEVNVFGHASIDWVYGGSGSGQVVPESGDASENVDFLEALDAYFVETNTELTEMYHDFAAPVGDIGSIGTFYNQFYRLSEPEITDTKYYSASLLENAENYSETAFVVIGRHAGETEDPTRIQYKSNTNKGNDETRHYLEISTEEEALLTYVGKEYDNVIVIINSTNTMELDFVNTIPGIDACLVVGATGTRGASAIPELLYGDYSPSGHFADTYPYAMSDNVSYLRTSSQGIGHYGNDKNEAQQTDLEKEVDESKLYPTGAGNNAGVSTRQAPAFIDYMEGIYVGYKWFETADAEGVWNDYSREILDINDDEITVTGYDSVVQYPFGYGMSYSDFSWTVQSVTLADGSALAADSEIKIEVLVQNTGTTYAGGARDVVQVYLEPEYYEGEIEKSVSNLVGFAKTSPLAPGESEVLTIEIDPYDLASYDAYDLNQNSHKGYELDRGSYKLKLMTNSHEVKTVDFIGGESGVPGVITYNVESTIDLVNDRETGVEVNNKFTGEDTLQGVSLDGSDSEQNIGFISRSSFPKPSDIQPIADREMTTEMAEYNLYTLETGKAWDEATTDLFGNPVSTDAVTWGVKAGTLEHEGVSYADSVENGYAKVYKGGSVTNLGLALGSNYDHPLWEPVLDQMTLSEAISVIEQGSFGNAAIDSVGKPRLSDLDGPNQVKSFNAAAPRGTAFPCATVVAQTWNKSLAYSFGINYGSEMTALGVDGVYGFGANLHRSPWGGRNYEYFSEDGFLAGEMLAQEVRGLKNTGHYGYLKHLALYETEHERDSLYTWCNEQALREVYLKPFQIAIKEGGCVGIMSSYNRIGNVWTGGSEALIEGVVRGEWGFDGAIVTDYVDSWSESFMCIEQAVRSGGDICLGGINSNLKRGYDDTPRIQARAKEVAHHVLYMFLSAKYANSVYNAQDDVDQIVSGSVIESWEWWKPALIDLDILVGGGCLIWVYFILRSVWFGKKIDDEAVETVEE